MSQVARELSPSARELTSIMSVGLGKVSVVDVLLGAAGLTPRVSPLGSRLPDDIDNDSAVETNIGSGRARHRGATA